MSSTHQLRNQNSERREFKSSLTLVFQLLKSTRVQEYSVDDLKALATYVLSREKVTGHVDLTLDLTRPKRIQALNRRFRGVDRPTDVIAFRYDTAHPHPLPLSPKGEPACRQAGVAEAARRQAARPAVWRGQVRVGPGFEGDIAINVPQARLQARDHHQPARREIRLLFIHGILHLLGYTDYDPRPRRKMFQRQNQLLRQWESLPRDVTR